MRKHLIVHSVCLLVTRESERYTFKVVRSIFSVKVLR